MAVPLMFLFTLGGWILFRSHTWGDFTSVLHALTVWPDSFSRESQYVLIWLAFHLLPLWVLQFVTRKAQDESALTHRHWALRGVDYAVMFLLVASSAAIEVEFIYFQF